MRLNPHTELSASSICIATHCDDVHQKLTQVIEDYFYQPERELIDMDLAQYRQVMYAAQAELNRDAFSLCIIKSIQPTLANYLSHDAFLIQSNLYLRASRPGLPAETENIGWHRESFYGPNLSKSINIWTPIKGVSDKNSLRFIPESQLIPDDKIITKNIGERSTKRFSVGHKLGFNYNQKVIESGVDLSGAKTLWVPVKHSALFSGNLIHGAAVNRDKKIRFSVDFQVIKKKHFSAKNKNFHFSSGKPYFVEAPI